MPRPIAEVLADRYTEHSVGLHRVQESVWQQVDKILVKLHQDLAKMLRMVDPVSGNSEALASLLDRRSKKMTLKAFKEIHKLVTKELGDVSQLESDFFAKTLAEALELSLEDEV